MDAGIRHRHGVPDGGIATLALVLVGHHHQLAGPNGLGERQRRIDGEGSPPLDVARVIAAGLHDLECRARRIDEHQRPGVRTHCGDAFAYRRRGYVVRRQRR